MARTVLAHLNVTLPDDDARTVPQIREIIATAVQGITETTEPPLDVALALVEEV